MAITQNGSKNLIKALFGYNYTTTGVGNVVPPALLTGASVSGKTISWTGQASSFAVNSQVVLTTGGITYVGFVDVATTSASSVTVDGWFNPISSPITWGLTSSLTASGLTVAVNSQPNGAFFLGLSSLSISNYGQTTESGFTELTGSGLDRARATIAVTSVSSPTGASNTASTITLSNTWTYTGSASVTVRDLAVYTAPYTTRAQDTMIFCTQIASGPTLSTNGDQLVVTETISQS